MLNAEDYILRSKRQKLHLPKLLSPKLPDELLTKFSIPQLRVENIYLENQNSQKRAEIGGNNLSYEDIAKKLKHKADKLFDSQEYCFAAACFVESYLLFTAQLYQKCTRNQTALTKSKNGRVTELDWIELAKYGVRISKRLNTISGDKSTATYTQSVRPAIGMCYFVNAFILKYLLEAKEKKLKLMIDSNEGDPAKLSRRMKLAVEKLLRVQDSFNNSMVKGEKYLPITDIIHKYPRLVQHSKSLSEVELAKLVIPKREQMFEETNYTLPIAGHTFSLPCIVNFGLYFVCEWAKQENADYKWSF